MNLDATEDQVALANLVRSICDDHCSTAVVRQVENDPTGYPAPLWEKLREAGLTATLIPEDHGGNPVSMLENAAIFQQLGRALAPTPLFVSSVVSALVLKRCEQSQSRGKMLSSIASGELIVTPAWLEPDGGFSANGVSMTANSNRDGYQLTGNKRHVFFAGAAHRLLVLARTGDDQQAIDLFVVDRESPGLTLVQEQSIAADSQFLVQFDAVQVSEPQRLTRNGRGWEIWQDSLSEAIILDAAYAVGLAERALEITVAYASEREQFGKPIAAFQAISHYLADCSTAIEGAHTLVYEAAWAHSREKPFRVLAAMSKLFACDTARDVTAKAQQIHGGIGFTLDYDIQLFFRRAKQQQLNWWDPRVLEEQIATAVLESDEPIAVSDPFQKPPLQH